MHSQELLVALCNQIALMSQIEMNRERLITEQVLLPLIEVRERVVHTPPVGFVGNVYLRV